MRKFAVLFTVLCFFFIAQSQSWLIDGNTGTNPKIHFIGNKDDSPLLFRINNQFSGKIDSIQSQTFFGFAAGRLTSGSENTAIGFKSLYSNTYGYRNTAYGAYSLYSNISGQDNVAIGDWSLFSNTTGRYNSANGYSALRYNSSGNYNTAHGWDALLSNTTGSANVANGYNTMLLNATGSCNTAYGSVALASNTSGSYNTATGWDALSYSTTASYNTGSGAYALYNNFAAQYNTAVGYRAAANYSMGWNNTIIGANSDINAAGLYNCVALGESVTCTASSQARIGNSATGSIGGYVNWSNISDGRIKRNVQENVPGLSFIGKLKPVTYNLDLDEADKIVQTAPLKDGNGEVIPPSEFVRDARKQKEKIIYTGFIAQDVEKAAKELNYDFSGVDAAKNDKDLYALRYAEFVVPLVKAVQELSIQNIELKNQMEAQKKINEDLQERLKRLESSFVTKK